MQSFLQDLGFGVRLLRKTPGFTAIAILVLALGIGANASIFGLVNACLLRPLSGAQSGTLYGLFARGAHADDWREFSYPGYREIRERAPVFASLAAHALTLVGVRQGDETRKVMGSLVSSNYFDALGAPVLRGRGFSPGEERDPAAEVAVVSDAWAEAHGGVAEQLGASIVVNSRTLTIVGVTAPGFTGTTALVSPDVWMPLGLYDAMIGDMERRGVPRRLEDRANQALMLFGRLGPGISRASATARLDVLAADLRRASPSDSPDEALVLHELPRLVMSSAPQTDGVLAAPFAMLLAMAGIVLLVACLNLANMLLARGEARRKEIAVRLAIGGGRGRILRQLLTEALLLALAGGAAGVALAWGAQRALVSSIAPLLPFTMAYDARPDTRVLLATLAVCVLSTVLAALGPALRVTGGDVLPDLQQTAGVPRSRGRRGAWSPRHLLVVGQIALSLVLVSSALLFIQGARQAAATEPGFALAGGVVAELDASLAGYDEDRGRAAFGAVLERVRALPGVAAASPASIVPFGMVTNSRHVETPESRATSKGGPDPASRRAVFVLVGADYFRTLGLSLLRGREFDASEETRDAHRSVAIVDEPLARRLWPGQDPIGRTVLDVADDGKTAATYEVVGVAPGVRHNLFNAEPVAHLYVPTGARYQANLTLHVKAAAGGPGEAALLDSLRREIRAVDGALPIVQLRSLRAHRDASILLWAVRAVARLFTSLGVLALFLSVVGVYGLRAFLVAQRTREIGIRMALGATPGDVRRLVLGEGLTLLGWGLGIGLLLSALAARLLSSLLFQASAADPLVFTAAPLLLGAATLLACDLPARRATRIAPTVALRHD